MLLIMNDIRTTPEIQTNIQEFIKVGRHIERADGLRISNTYKNFIIDDVGDYFDQITDDLLQYAPVLFKGSLPESQANVEDLLLYLDADEVVNINLSFIYTRNRDIVIITTSPDTNKDWLGLIYNGSDFGLSEVLFRLGISLDRAIDNQLREPVAAPEGYDDTLSVHENFNKVLIERDEVPAGHQSICEKLFGEERNGIILSKQEYSDLTYEDYTYDYVQGGTVFKVVIYREIHYPENTYVITYLKGTNVPLDVFVLNEEPNRLLTKIIHDDLLAAADAKLERSIRTELY